METGNISSPDTFGIMVESDTDLETIGGLTIIGISFVSQIMALVIMRILQNLNRGGKTVVFRMWLYLASGIEQVSFFVFHLKYHVLGTDDDDPDTCIVLRFLVSCTSTFTMTWVFVITAFYFGLTIKPSRCFSFHARFLSFCFTYTWAGVSSLMYLLMAFMLRRVQHHSVIVPCWNNIHNTIHLYLTYGNELLVFALVIVIALCTRMRVWCKRRHIVLFALQDEFKEDFSNLIYKINTLLLMIVLLCVYYVCLLHRITLGVGSDLPVMIIHSAKGFVIVLTTCFLDKNVINLLGCRARRNHTNGYIQGSITDTEGNIELHTFVLE